MDWPQVFTLIKSMLNELEMVEGISYSKLQFRSGNNDIIKLITDNMAEILVKSHLIMKSDNSNSDLNSDCDIIEWDREKADKLREVLLFLMFNTDVNYRRNIKQCNESVAHLYHIFDLLPPFLFMEIVWTCQLDNSFIEMLSYAPAWLSHPFYEEANRSLSFLSDPFDVVTKIESIFKAIIVSIAVSRGLGLDSLHEIMIRGTMPAYVDKLLLHLGNESELMRKFKGAKLKQFKGHVILNLLEMCATAIKKVYKQRLFMPAECSIYETFMKKKVIWKNVQRNDLIRTLFTKVLNTLQNVLLSIDIDTFMEWTEIETEGGYENLQERIGILTFTLNEHLNHKSALVKHDVKRELKVFMIKPIPFLKRLKEATIGKLLNMLEDKTLLPYQIKNCCNEIFSRSIIYGNDECINNLVLYADILNVSHCKRVIGFMITDLKRTNFEYQQSEETYDCEEDKYSNLVKLLYAIYKKLSAVQKMKFLMFRQKHFANYADIGFKFSYFHKRYHSFWNQLDTKFDKEQFLLLCFESEDAMWQQLFAHLLAANKFFDLPWQLSESYTELCLSNVMTKSLLISDQIKSKFYGNVFFNNYMKFSGSTQKDMQNEILKVILNSTKKENFDMTYECIKLLNLISEETINSSSAEYPFNGNIANVLFRVAFAMNKALWRVRSFSYKRARLVSECQKFLEINSRDFVKKSSSRSVKDMSKCIGGFPISHQAMYYMRAFFVQEREVPFIVFMEVCFKKKESVKEHNLMIATILMRATESEFKNYAGLRHITPSNLFSTVLEMTFIVLKIDKEEAFNNFYYLYNAYMNWLSNALKNHVAYNKWCFDGLLNNIMEMINASQQMRKRLLADSSNLFVLWAQYNKNTGRQIINKLNEMTPSTQLLETLNKLNSIVSSSLPLTSSSSMNKAEKEKQLKKSTNKA